MMSSATVSAIVGLEGARCRLAVGFATAGFGFPGLATWFGESLPEVDPVAWGLVSEEVAIAGKHRQPIAHATASLEIFIISPMDKRIRGEILPLAICKPMPYCAALVHMSGPP
jgi:hypothetical protein